MERTAYAERVIEKVHHKTLQGELQWRCDKGSISIDPTPRIQATFGFDDDGPEFRNLEKCDDQTSCWQGDHVIAKSEIIEGETI